MWRLNEICKQSSFILFHFIYCFYDKFPKFRKTFLEKEKINCSSLDIPSSALWSSLLFPPVPKHLAYTDDLWVIELKIFLSFLLFQYFCQTKSTITFQRNSVSSYITMGNKNKYSKILLQRITAEPWIILLYKKIYIEIVKYIFLIIQIIFL